MEKRDKAMERFRNFNCLACPFLEDAPEEYKSDYGCQCALDPSINSWWNQGASAGTLNLNAFITPEEYWNGGKMVDSKEVGPYVPFACPLLQLMTEKIS